MPNTHKNFTAGSALHTQGAVQWSFIVPTASATSVVNAFSLTGAVAGTAVTLTAAAVWMRAPFSLAFAPAYDAAETVVYTVVGENQFGSVVSEDVTTTVTTVVQTVNCYRKVNSITVKTVTGTLTGNTISVGINLSAGNPRVPLPSRTVPETAVKAIAFPTSGFNTTFVFNRASNCLVLSVIPPAGEALIYVDPVYADRA